MGREYPSDTLWRAQEMYCVDRLSYAAIAEALGVSATTLKSWGQKYEWGRRKAEIAQAECEIRINVIKGREAALKQLLNAESAKEAAPMAFAVSSLESLALKRMELAAEGKLPQAMPKKSRKIANRADAIHALREAVEMKLGFALSDPDKITVANVQDIKKCLELVAELEAGLPKENEVEESKKRGISGSMAESIYKAIGIAEDG